MKHLNSETISHKLACNRGLQWSLLRQRPQAEHVEVFLLQLRTQLRPRFSIGEASEKITLQLFGLRLQVGLDHCIPRRAPIRRRIGLGVERCRASSKRQDGAQRGAAAASVAQVANLLYRRLPIGQACKNSWARI